MYKKCLKPDLDTKNITFNFLNQDDNTENVTSVKPVMHTFVDDSNNYVEEELLDLWKTSWEGAGWEIKILTPEDASSHVHFKEFEIMLLKNSICCMPRQTYLRHLAMSTVKEGGFYSEAYVFPLNSDLYLQEDGHNITIPHQGNFTSWDGIQGSLMSG